MNIATRLRVGWESAGLCHCLQKTAEGNDPSNNPSFKEEPKIATLNHTSDCGLAGKNISESRFAGSCYLGNNSCWTTEKLLNAKYLLSFIAKTSFSKPSLKKSTLPLLRAEPQSTAF